MKEIKLAISEALSIPEWSQSLIANLFAIYIILNLISLIIKKLQTPELRSTIAKLKNLSGEALRKAGRSLELPVEHPKLALVSLAFMNALTYVFSIIFFTYFGIALILASSDANIAIIERLLIFFLSGVLFIISRWYYAFAERQRIALVEKWKLDFKKSTLN